MLQNLNMTSDMIVVVPRDSSLEQYLELQNEIIKGLTYPYTPGATYSNYENKPVIEEHRALQTLFTETVMKLTSPFIESQQILSQLDDIKGSREREYALHVTGYVRLNGEHRLNVRFIRHPGIVGNLMKQYVTSIKAGYKKNQNGNNKGEDKEILVSGALRATHLGNGSLVIPLNPVIIHAKPLGDSMSFRVWYARMFADSFATPKYPNVSLAEAKKIEDVCLSQPFVTTTEFFKEKKK